MKLDVDKFKKFLDDSGADVKNITNEYEVVRFKVAGTTSIIYRDKTGKISSMTGLAQDAHIAFINNRRWYPEKGKRRPMSPYKAKLIKRHGERCFFHGEYLSSDDLTVEHIVEVSRGGPNNIHNLCLVCKPCNLAVLELTAAEKMLFRDIAMASGVAGKQERSIYPTELKDVKVKPKRSWRERLWSFK